MFEKLLITMAVTLRGAPDRKQAVQKTDDPSRLYSLVPLIDNNHLIELKADMVATIAESVRARRWSKN